MNGNNLELSLQNDGIATQTVDFSGFTNTDNQDLNLAGNTLSLTNDGTTVNLAPYLDNTDNQTLTYTGTTLTIANGNSVNIPNGAVEGSQSNGTVSIYPVPTTDVLTVDFSNWKHSNTTIDLRVIDVHGRVLITKNASIEQNSLIKIHEVKDLLPGTYFLVATSDSGLNFVRKFTRNED